MKKSNLDEMQELKLLHIERNGCWIAFWGLLAAIVIQTVWYEDHIFEHMAGEWIVFMCLTLYMAGSCLRHGIWDRRYRPDTRTNLFWSLFAAIIVGVTFFMISYKRYGALIGSVAAGAFMFMITFLLTIIALAGTAALYKKRVNELETEIDESDEEA